MLRLVESQSGQKIMPGEEWRNDAQPLALKLYQAKNGCIPIYNSLKTIRA